MLTKQERDQVQEEFEKVLAFHPSPPNSLLQVVFRAAAEEIVRYLPPNAGYGEIAYFTVTSCLTSRWTRDPALLEMLLDYLDDKQGIGAFHDLLLRVRQHIDPNPSAYNSAWLFGDRPFFDRQDFRHRVQLLVEGNGRPILRVSAAAEGFGRTYSRCFLEHLEDRSPDTVHVLAAELSPGAGPSYQVLDLLETVGAQLGAHDPFPERRGSSYPTSAARWLLTQMTSRAGLWLLVLDGFGQEELTPEVRETIEAFAASVPSGQFRRRIRLVLLDYPHELPRVSTADVLEEILQPAARVTRTDLEPCLADWDAERKQIAGRGLDVGERAKLADGILSCVPIDGKERLAALNDELCKLCGFS